MIYVHMGMPKTGTSSLQQMLSSNRAELGKAGLHYISANTVNANPWFEGLRPIRLMALTKREVDDRLHQTKEALFANIKSNQTTILSAEVLSNLSPEHLLFLFSGAECRFIAYVRDEISFLASSYAQLVHSSPEPPKLEDYLNGRLNNHLGNFLQKFSDSLGDRFVPRIFIRDELKDGDIVADFFGSIFPDLKLPFDTAENSSQQNPSISDRVIAFKLGLAESRPDLFIHNATHYSALVKLSEQFGGRFRLPKIKYAWLADYFAEAQSSWAPKFFGRQSIFDYHAYPFDERPEGAHLSPSDVASMLAAYQDLLN